MSNPTRRLLVLVGAVLVIAGCADGATGPSGPASEERKPPFIDCSAQGAPSTTACLRGSPPP
jgi:hypothetical protein